MKYKDEIWLREQRETHKRSITDIATECGVSDTSVTHFAKKYGVSTTRVRPPRMDSVIVEVLCHECKMTTEKTLKYLAARIRKGNFKFYCSRKCTDASHSKEMRGEGNPNFEGKFHAECASTWSVQKREQASKKVSETMLRNGTSKGDKNGRWVGGDQEHDCVICGKTSSFRPYTHRKIEASEQSPTCSIQCAASLARRSIPFSRTSIELKMMDELDRHEIKYIEQYNLGDKFSLDFLLPEYNIVIECDGDYWHNLPYVLTRDKRKNAYIKACGFPLFRFWEHEINADVEACVDIVMTEINSQLDNAI